MFVGLDKAYNGTGVAVSLFFWDPYMLCPLCAVHSVSADNVVECMHTHSYSPYFSSSWSTNLPTNLTHPYKHNLSRFIKWVNDIEIVKPVQGHNNLFSDHWPGCNLGVYFHRVQDKEVLFTPMQGTDQEETITIVTPSGSVFTRQIKMDEVTAVQETKPATQGLMVFKNHWSSDRSVMKLTDHTLHTKHLFVPAHITVYHAHFCSF